MPGKLKNGFPLFKHRNGQWAKKVRGKFHYFGTNREEALQRWLAEKDYHLAGVPVPTDSDSLRVRDILNEFYRFKRQQSKEGAVTNRTFREYQSICDIIAETLGKDRDVRLLTPDVLGDLRRKLIT
jgi:hypothetical protein